VYFRALVNFTQSIDYSPRLDDANSEEFREVSEAVVDTLESEYYKIGGEQVVSVVFIKEIDGCVFVELDVGSEGNLDEGEIREVLYSVIRSGSIASYVTSTQGFQFRRLGEVPLDVRACTGEEFACRSGECIEKEFRCDRRPDCRDMSDELDCECPSEEFRCGTGECLPLAYRCDRSPDCRDGSDEHGCNRQEVVTLPPLPITTAQPATTRTPTTSPSTPMITTRRVPATTPPRLVTPKHPPIRHPLEQRPCRRDEAVCSNKQCIPRDYLCDGERDCLDGSDELSCGTPTPCEPNEFKCRNGHCALKLWRCDGDNDCVDGSDEVDCPTKGPGDTCSPDQFICVSSRTCIPASYQCDEEADCPDRSDEVGCTPPQVITPPEESVQATPGQTVRFRCVAVGVPTPIITWRLNWGHIPANRRVSISSENGHGMLTIRDVKEADQGAYTCEAINARGMVFGIPDGVLSLTPQRGPCPEGHFHVEGTSKCLACFCFGITTACQGTSRYRDKIRLRFDTPEDFKGVNVTTPAQLGTLPLSSTQLQIDPALQEFQLVDLSRRFLAQNSFWTLPSQFLGNKVDSYGGDLSFQVRYGLARGQSEPVQKSSVVIVGNGQKLIYRVQVPTQPSVINRRQIHFTEENWQHESGAPVSRETLLLALQNLESILVQTVYDNKMASVGLSDIAMDTTTMELTSQGMAQGVEECRCPIGYLGLSCERCDARFERVPEGPYLGTCSGCNCHGHSSSCDRVFGYCLNCQHNTEGPQCNKCKPGFFGDATRGNATACRACPCPYTDSARRFSNTCFLDTDGQATCDDCAPGYTGRRCESCARGYEGNPMQPGGRCVTTAQEFMKCDKRGSSDSTGGSCRCKPNVVGRLCNECTPGAFYLSDQNPDGCLKCFCMGVSRQCASSSWNREQVRAMDGEQEHFSLANLANTRTVSEGIRFPSHAELAFSAFHSLPRDVYYWVLPDRFKGDKVTSYGGELHYTVTHSAAPRAPPPPSQPDVLLRGNGTFLEHFTEAGPLLGTPTRLTVPFREPDVLLRGNGTFLEHFTEAGPLLGTPTRLTVPFRERAWRRADGQDATREHLLMALADIDLFMIRASYMDRPTESRLSNIHMDVAVPHATGLEQAVEVEECTCPPGYRGPSCQDCDVGYARTTSGLYLGTCERCDCSGHSAECDAETGDCQNCQDNTEGTRCERCKSGYYGDARRGTPADCQPCPCHRPYATSQATKTCFLDTDGQPTCNACTTGYVGRQCQRCAPGYLGNPSLGQPCRGECHGSEWQLILGGSLGCAPGYLGNPSLGQPCRESHKPNGNCSCDPQGSVSRQCDASRQCQCKPHVEGPSCSSCRANHFHLSAENRDGCLPCFCMGVTQQCTSSSYYRGLVTSPFLPGDFQSFALVNRQHSTRIATGFAVEPLAEGPQLSFGHFGQLGQESYYWQLPEPYQGDKNSTSLTEEQLRNAVAAGMILGSGGGNRRVRRAAKVGSYGGRLRYTLSYNSGGRSAPLPDADVQITGNDITLVAYQPELLPRDRQSFEIVLREQYWKRPDGQHATREHLMMALADLDEILIRATYSTDMVSASIAGVSMETTVPTYSSLPRALEVEECRCPPGYRGLSCQDCAAGYTRTGGGLYLGHCELCECNGHSDSCHPETGACSNCLHNAAGEFCEQCAPGYYGDATAGTPEDCQPCACPLSEPENQCAPGYVGNPSVRGQKCVPVDRAPFVVRVHPSKTTVSQGGEVTLRCQASGSPPYYYSWSREDGRPVPSTAQSRRQGEELHFPSIHPSEAGVYVCTCRSLEHSNASRAEVIVTEAPSKPITVTVEEKRVQSVKPGADVTFICTAKSKSPAYTLVWTRQNHGKLPRRAMDFNGILTIRNVQPEDAGIYVCTGSNMLDMAEGTATLHVQAPSKTQMFYGPIEVMEGHRPSVIQGGTLRFPAVEPSDEAEYLCRVRSSAGQHVARAFLQVHGSSVLQVQVSPERTEVQEGSTVRLYCRAAGSPTATITWEKQGGSLPPQSRSEHTDIATLVIPSITAADSGVYLCIGTSPAGVGSARIEVVVLRASGVEPPIRIEASSSSVTEGQTLDLNCLIAGQAPATVTWYKRGGSLPARHQVSGSHLRISQVSAADSGEYVCRVSIGASPHEASIPVTVQHSAGFPHAPPIRIESSSSAVTEGQSLDLNCLVTGQSPATVMWYKRGGSLPDGHQVSGSHLRLVRGSAANSGEYVCRASTSAGIQEASIIVTIYRATGSPYSSGVESPVRIESSSSSIAEGQTMDLKCLVAGQAPAMVTWYKRRGSLPASHQVSGSHLRIPQVSAADSGEYVCRVSTGAVVQEASIIVTVSSAGSSYSLGIRPPIRIEQSSSSVTEGQTLDLNCLVAGQAAATVTWYKRGGSLPADHQLSGSRLRLVQVSAADSGEYVCRAGNKEASVIITIQQSSSISYPSGVTPPVRIESSSSSVAEGQTLDLKCLVAGQVQPRVTWHKRGGSLPAGHQVSGSRLRIPQVSAADSGEYICRVSTGAVTQETSLIVTIQGGAGSSYSLGVTPPVRIETSSASIAEGQTLDLNCLVSGSRLRIPQVSAADSGEYICRVSNSTGPLEASVIVTIPRSAGSSYPLPALGVAPPVRIESSSSSIAEGQTLDLNCLVAGQEQPRVRWYKRGGSLPASHQVSGSRLRIPQVSAADSGEYVCRVSTGAVTQEAALVVTIEDSTGPSHSSGVVPRVRIESSSSSIAEGQTLDLNCLVAGQAPSTVTWYKRGGALPASHQVSGSHLRLGQVSAADSGEYVCRVSTSAGPREASITVSVSSGTSSSYRLQSPIISIEPHSTAVRQGEDATFKCRIHDGARPINITWKMAPKQQLQDNVKISPNGSVITISRARPSNQGAYRCVASNRYGVANSVVNLMVQGSPTVSVMPQGPVTVKTGKSISLDCLGMGDPRPLVRWSRLGMRQKIEHQTLLPLESQAVLQISAAKSEDAGTYICTAQNSIGSAQVQVEVSVEAAHGKPGAPEITVKPTLTVVAGETATLQCSATGHCRSSDRRRHRPGQNCTESPSQGQVAESVRQTQTLGIAAIRVPARPPLEADSRQTARVQRGSPQQVRVAPGSLASALAPMDPRSPNAAPSGGSLSGRGLGKTVGLPLSVPQEGEGERSSPAPCSEGDQVLGSVAPVGTQRTVLPSSPSPDEGITAPPPPVSQEDTNTHQELLKREASSLSLQAEEVEEPSDSLFDVLSATALARVALPLHEGVVKISNALWQILSSLPPISKRAERKYFVPAKGHEYLYPHPNSLVVKVVNHKEHQGQPAPTPKNKDSRRLDLFGQKLYSSSRFQLRVANHQALLGRYDFNSMPKFTFALQEHNRKEYKALVEDGTAAVRAALQAASDAVDMAARTMASAVSMRRTLWLLLSGLSSEGQSSLQDLPFDDKALFSEQTDMKLHGLKDSCTTLKTLCDPPPTIQWSKLRAPLPWQHRVVNNTLLIPRVAQQDSGQYICNASNAASFTEAFVTLDVEIPPYATSLPEEVSVQAGEAVQLQCLAHGTPPLRYQWTKANGSLSSHAVLRESALHISPIAPEDSGTYRCLVSNRVGSAETFAQVSVQGSAPSASPTVRVTPQTDVKGVGGTAEFTCSVTGDAQARIEWFREGGELPASHSVRNGVLRIQNLDRGCQGVYTCRVSSPSGQAQDSARLVIQALPKVMINVRTSVQSVLVGAAVEFECLVVGDPKARITWSKVGSRIRPEVVVSGGMVKIERVEQSDAGQYRCTATNDMGTMQSNVILHVQSIPQIAAQPEVKEVTTGSRAVLPCLASGFPVPEIKWTKLEGDLPKDICLENNILTIPSVKPEDAGIYVCTASNRQGKVTAFSMLKVQERVVPYFTQNPQTFLALPTIKDAYKKFEIQITFRPDTADALILYSGMLLYNGQKKSTGADFVSFGLVGGRPEFRFDAGSGMATIRHPAPIRLGEFHTVRLYRNLTQGSLVLDSHPPVNGTSQGKFQGLDLNEELYLGGYPDYTAVAKSGLSSGFVGECRRAALWGEEVIFKDLDLGALGISNCPTCRDRPCQNGGICRDSESSSYVCHCPQEFTGSNCEHSQALHCHPEACGPDATCINRADGQGYRCRCHLGKSGETCMEGVMATTPSFNGSNSFISYPPLTNIHYELRLEVEFKPLSPSGLILFSGGSGAPVEDFVSLAMASGHVEFRYELGSGMAVLQSTEPLALGQWHKVSAERINKDGTLQVDSSKPVKRSSPGKSQGLNLRTPMYLGGVDKSVTLPAAASISSSFHGCIGEVSINGKKVDISYSFLQSRGITQCYDSSPCDRRPCLHGATCMPTGEYEFQCLCQDGFRGNRCELSEDQCLLRNPCLNGGMCKANQCLCPAGFSGTYCEQGLALVALDREWALEGSGGNDAPGQYGAYFQDSGYLALPRHLLPHSHPKSPETIELEVRTRSPNGLLLWQGVEQGQNGKAKDFISLGLRDGHLVFSYQLGSGEASIVSEDPINDGEWHRVTAVREGRRGSIQVDGEELVSGESPGSNIMVNTQGSVYIDGVLTHPTPDRVRLVLFHWILIKRQVTPELSVGG
ncbi:Basement membrane-specific heparan sulfate proteoglycan core protein, partial [Chelonia mydas]